jgi:predicted GNAT family N-acyltransferase
MITTIEPKLLTDKSQLQDIYDLRVIAFEDSPKSCYVNHLTFPNGWYDHLDTQEQTHHWIIEEDKKIVAASRVAFIGDLSEIEDLGAALDTYNIPQKSPFAYFSRLVVYPRYRGQGYAAVLDAIRLDFLYKSKELNFAIAWCSPSRKEALKNLGFNYVGDFNYTWGGNQSHAQCMHLLPLK